MSKEVDDLTSDYASEGASANEDAVKSHTQQKRKRRLDLRSIVNKNEVKEIKLSEIKTEDQPRKFFDDERLAELAESIEQRGQLEPIKVIKSGKGYRLIFGERRFRACKLIPGKTTISALVYDSGLSDKDVILDQLAENVHREDLHPIEKALGLSALLGLPSLGKINNSELAKWVGKSETYVSRLLSLCHLSGEYLDLLLVNTDVFSNKFIYDELPAIINRNKSNLDPVYKGIYDSIEQKQNVFQAEAKPVATATSLQSLQKKKPGRRAPTKALDFEVLKCKTNIGLRTSVLKRIHDPEKRKYIVEDDVKKLLASIHGQLKDRLKPYLSESDIDDILQG